jgi:hypothetical protein
MKNVWKGGKVMDAKTLEWMNERANKGNEIQAKLTKLKIIRRSIVDSNTVRLEFSLETEMDRKSTLSLHTGTTTLKSLQQYYSVISSDLIASIDKEIADLEAEFAEL